MKIFEQIIIYYFNYLTVKLNFFFTLQAILDYFAIQFCQMTKHPVVRYEQFTITIIKGFVQIYLIQTEIT